MTDTRIVTAPTVRPVMQVAAGDGTVQFGQAVYDTARYGVYPEATYAGSEPRWSDGAECDVVEARTYYGRQRAVASFDVGTATVRVYNPAGYWDYPQVSELTPLAVRPGRAIRVGVIIDDAAPVWLFTGVIDSTAPAYDAAAAADVVEVSAVCAKGDAGRVDTIRLTAPLADETVTARMDRYADTAGVPIARRQFDPSSIMLKGTTLGGRLGQLMDRSAQSAAGDVYGDEHGNLVYRNADWQTRPVSPADGSIGNRGVSGEVCPNGWELEFQRSDFTSRVNYGVSGGPYYTLDDLPNQERFGIETYSLLSLETVDPYVALQVASRMLRVRSFDRAPWVRACTLDAARPGVIALLSTASPFLPSVYQCGHVAPDGRTVFSRTSILTGVEHTITAGQWTARLSFDDAVPFIISDNSRYDAAHYDADRYAQPV